MSDKKFVSVSVFERTNGVKLSSKVKASDLANDAPDSAKIPKAFDFDPEWLMSYAFKEKGFFKKVVQSAKKEKEYQSRVIKLDNDNSILMVTEKGTYSYRVALDTIGIEEDGVVINGRKPSEFNSLKSFVMDTVAGEQLQEEFGAIAKRGELILIVQNDILKIAIETLKCFQS